MVMLMPTGVRACVGVYATAQPEETQILQPLDATK